MSAEISPCGRYRYVLTRRLEGILGGAVVFCMLNPSTADAAFNDPTINRCIDFATRWGYGELLVVNLFAFRSTDPRGLREAIDPIGPGNGAWIERTVANRTVICAWGAHGTRDIVGATVKLMLSAGAALKCLGTTKSGMPKHPLYLRADLKPQPWNWP